MQLPRFLLVIFSGRGIAMAMSYVWVILLFVSVVFGALTGSAGAVCSAAVQYRKSVV